jgi:hypothetical protein
MLQQHGTSPRPEIKSTHIRRSQGPLKPLKWSLARRMKFFRNVLRYEASDLPALTVFAVAVQKSQCHANGFDPRETAWQFALQRVHTFCEKNGDERAMLFPDEGHFYFIRHLIRRMRDVSSTFPGICRRSKSDKLAYGSSGLGTSQYVAPGSTLDQIARPHGTSTIPRYRTWLARWRVAPRLQLPAPAGRGSVLINFAPMDRPLPCSRLKAPPTH